MAKGDGVQETTVVRSREAAEIAEEAMRSIDRDHTHEQRMEAFAEAQVWATLSVGAAIRERFLRHGAE